MEQIKGYRLIYNIDSGQTAFVFKGLQLSSSRTVAVRVLSKKLAEHSIIAERFNQESLIISRLSHPGIISIIDWGLTPAGMPYFVTEYIEGRDLSDIIRARKLDLNRKLYLIVQLSKALSYAHTNSVLHLNIKPSKVLIDSRANARLLDFGIAQFDKGWDTDSVSAHSYATPENRPDISPEQQSASGSATLHSDLYCFGALMFELFTGNKPQRSRTDSEGLPGLPGELSEMIMRCLDPDPANRPASAGEIRDCLLKLLGGAHLFRHPAEASGRGEPGPTDDCKLLDNIKQNKYGSVDLFQNRTDHNLMVIKKLPCKSAGFGEAHRLTSLKHKNIVSIISVSKNNQHLVIAMEYLRGGSLQDRLIRPFAWDEALMIMREICEGLSFALQNSILHGNLRPSNIMFTETGRLKITDFGQDEHYSNRPDLVNWYSLKGQAKSPGSDIFAAGIIFFQMLTGSLPEWVGTQLVPNEHLELLPDNLQKMVDRMISNEEDNRYCDFDRVMADIDALKTAPRRNPPSDFQAGTCTAWLKRHWKIFSEYLGSFFKK